MYVLCFYLVCTVGQQSVWIVDIFVQDFLHWFLGKRLLQVNSFKAQIVYFRESVSEAVINSREQSNRLSIRCFGDKGVE